MLEEKVGNYVEDNVGNSKYKAHRAVGLAVAVQRKSSQTSTKFSR